MLFFCYNFGHFFSEIFSINLEKTLQKIRRNLSKHLKNKVLGIKMMLSNAKMS